MPDPSPIRPVPPRPRLRGIAWLVIGSLFIAVTLLVELTPHRIGPPQPTPARADDPFIDKVGLVSQPFAFSTAGTLLAQPAARMLVYIDHAPASGGIEEFTVRMASLWKVGSARADDGVVLFIFPDARVARCEVGYGLEGALPDAAVRTLLDATLVPAFARGEPEAGITAFLAAVQERIMSTGDLRPPDGAWDTWRKSAVTGARRTALLLRDTIDLFRGADRNGRWAVALFVLAGIGILAAALFFLGMIVATLVAMPSRWRSSPTRLDYAGPRPARSLGYAFGVSGDLNLHFIPMALFGATFCGALAVALILNLQDTLPYDGTFGGGGVTIALPRPA